MFCKILKLILLQLWPWISLSISDENMPNHFLVIASIAIYNPSKFRSIRWSFERLNPGSKTDLNAVFTAGFWAFAYDTPCFQFWNWNFVALPRSHPWSESNVFRLVGKLEFRTPSLENLISIRVHLTLRNCCRRGTRILAWNSVFIVSGSDFGASLRLRFKSELSNSFCVLK